MIPSNPIPALAKWTSTWVRPVIRSATNKLVQLWHGEQNICKLPEIRAITDRVVPIHRVEIKGHPYFRDGRYATITLTEKERKALLIYKLNQALNDPKP
jgi:hypothetical protein